MAFDPWSYDTDKDCYISMSEAMAAVNDYNYGVITQSQSLQVVNLWQNGTKNPACGIGDWQLLATKTFTIQPSITGDWQLLATKTFTIQPSTTGDWQELASKTFTVTPEGYVPPVTCSVDADCPENEVCKGGKCVCAEGYERNASGVCVKKTAFPWQWVAIAGAAIAGVILLIPKPKKAKEKNEHQLGEERRIK
jgi:hypothetical protein